MPTADKSALFRRLPAVDELLRVPEVAALVAREGHAAVTEAARAVLERMRGLGIPALSPDEAMRDGFAPWFDVITCWHVLEHVERPMELTRWAQANLDAGGIFQVTVPNLASWQARERAASLRSRERSASSRSRASCPRLCSCPGRSDLRSSCRRSPRRRPRARRLRLRAPRCHRT